jgi:hypothetical protein
MCHGQKCVTEMRHGHVSRTEGAHTTAVSLSQVQSQQASTCSASSSERELCHRPFVVQSREFSVFNFESSIARWREFSFFGNFQSSISRAQSHGGGNSQFSSLHFAFCPAVCSAPAMVEGVVVDGTLCLRHYSYRFSKCFHLLGVEQLGRRCHGLFVAHSRAFPRRRSVSRSKMCHGNVSRRRVSD